MGLVVAFSLSFEAETLWTINVEIRRKTLLNKKRGWDLAGMTPVDKFSNDKCKSQMESCES